MIDESFNIYSDALFMANVNFNKRLLRWKRYILLFAIALLVIVLLVLAGLSFSEASKVKNNVLQSLLIEVAIGIGMFLTFHVLHALGKILKFWLLLIVLSISVCAYLIANYTIGTTQTIFIEISADLFLLAILERIFNSMVKSLRRKIQSTFTNEDEIERIADEIEDKQIVVGPYIELDDGTNSSVIQDSGTNHIKESDEPHEPIGHSYLLLGQNQKKTENRI